MLFEKNEKISAEIHEKITSVENIKQKKMQKENFKTGSFEAALRSPVKACL
jgi:hypothetical protein